MLEGGGGGLIRKVKIFVKPFFKKSTLYIVSGRKEMFYLTMHSTHFIYGYMASDIW